MRFALLAPALLTGCVGFKIPEVVYVDPRAGSVSTQPSIAPLTVSEKFSGTPSSLRSSPTISASVVEIKISGRFVGISDRPMVGVCRLTGTVDFNRRVVDYITMLPARPGPELEQVTRPDADGNYVLTGLDRGEESVALVFFSWDDLNGDGRYMGYRQGQLYEPLGQVYVYWRTPEETGFGRDFRMNPASLNQADFRF